MREMQQQWKGVRILTAVLALMAAVALAACGGSDESTTAAGNGGETSGGTDVSQERLDALYKGTYGLPPKTAPRSQPGKDVWLISCSQAAAACANGTNGAKEAADALGWNSTVYDTKGDPTEMLDAVRSAVAAKADGIFLYAIDCSLVKSGLEEAKQAGIPVVGAEAADCSDVDKGAPSLFSYVTHYVNDRTFPEFIQEWGAAQADWIIAQLDGEAKVVDFKGTSSLTVQLTDKGFRERIAACADCEIVDTVEFTVRDLGPALQQKAEQALLEHPDANAVHVPYDAVMTAGVVAALRASGNLPNMRIMGGEGDLANMDLIRSDTGQDAIVGLSTGWEGWAAIDNLNRIIAGEPTAETGIGLQVVDDEHNLPPSGPFVPQRDGKPIPYAELYEKAFEGK